MQLSSSPPNSERFSLEPSVSPTRAGAPPVKEESARGASPLHAARHLIEPDPNSFASDYSELGEPIREHLAGVQIIGREDLDLGNTVAASDDDPGGTEKHHHSLRRLDNETEEQFTRRVRKTNYLSLAQVCLITTRIYWCGTTRWRIKTSRICFIAILRKCSIMFSFACLQILLTSLVINDYDKCKLTWIIRLCKKRKPDNFLVDCIAKQIDFLQNWW